jgi:tetratricopeptide (TPR) repeat protein
MKHILILIFSVALVFNGFGQAEDEYFISGDAKFKLEDYRGAIADYTKAIEIDPKSAVAFHGRGFSKGNLKDFRGAIEDLTKAFEIDPQNSSYYFFRGVSKIGLEQIDSGCLDLSKAGELGHEAAYDRIRELCN